MTKKPSEKNKAWEKERRDRLNKSFDTLAKLLPKYDTSVTWSKIEVILKSIAHIEELQHKIEEHLKTNNPEVLNDYNEFTETLRYYQTRNNQLTELLKKAKITIPSFELPNLLKKDPKLLQESVSEIIDSNSKEFRKRGKYSNKIKANIKTHDVGVTDTDAKVKEGNASITTITSGVLVPVKILPLANTAAAMPLKPSVVKQPVKKIGKMSTAKLKIMPKPHVKVYYRSVDGKIPIPMLKRKLVPKKIYKRKRKPKIPIKMADEEPLKKPKLEVDTKHGAISPTAAFLMTFPVVSSSSGKNVDNVDNFENLNNFFTTKEYSNFCDETKAAIEEKKNTKPFEQTSKTISIQGIMPICTPLPLDTALAKNFYSQPVNMLGGNTPTKPLQRTTTIIEKSSKLWNVAVCTTNTSVVPIQTSIDKKLSLFPVVSCTQSAPITSTSISEKPTHVVTTLKPNESVAVSTSVLSSTFQPNNDFYYPSSSTSTNFMFNLTATNTSSSLERDSNRTKQFLSYSPIKSDLPWMPPPPPPTAQLPPPINAEYKSSFTFSLTPTTQTNATPSNSNNKKPIFETTTTSFSFSLTTPKVSEAVATNFTFALTKPSNTQPIQSKQKPCALQSTAASDQMFYDCEQYKSVNNKDIQKAHVNWMTSQSCNQSTSYYPPHAAATDDNQFLNWTPTDNSYYPNHHDQSAQKTTHVAKKSKHFTNNNNGNFLSVTQLVDQSSKDQKQKTDHTAYHLSSNQPKQVISNTYSAEALISKKEKHRNLATMHNNSHGGDYYNPTSNNSPGFYSNEQNYNNTCRGYFYPTNYPTDEYFDSSYGPTNDYSKTKLFPSITTSETSANYFPVPLAFDPPSNHQYYHQSSSNYHQNNNWASSTGNGNTHMQQSGGYHSNTASEGQHQNMAGNLPNFNLSSICPEINEKGGTSEW